MKKICIYLSGLGTSGGKERVIANLLREWADKYEITVITKNAKESFYKLPEKVSVVSLKAPFFSSAYNLSLSKVFRLPSLLMNSLSSMIKLRFHLRNHDYDYMYVSTPLEAFEAYYVLRHPEKKLVITEHASINAFNGVYSWMKRKIYPKSYCVSVPNSMDTKEYISWGCNAIFIPHLLTYKAESPNSLNEKIVLNVGRLTKDKQQDLLIDMWSRIKEKNEWKLQIIGAGEEEENLKKQIIACNVMDSVELLPARKDIHNVYKTASLFAFTSKAEGFGMVLLEAMSFGIPCISFDCPSGPRDIVRDGINGFLVSDQDQAEFMQRMQELLLLPEKELRKLGEGAFETIKNWDNEEILLKWDQLFK